MKTHNVVYVIMLVLCVAITVFDLVGVLQNVPWVRDHIPTFTLLTLGLLGTYAMTTYESLSKQLGSLGKRIEETASLSMQDKGIISLFTDFWKETDKDSETFFGKLREKLKSGKRVNLPSELDLIYKEIAGGNFLGTTVPYSFVFTVVAVTLNGVVLFHPDQKLISMTLTNQDAFQRIIQQRSGCITYDNTNLSEQMLTTFPRRPYKIRRITRAYFKEFPEVKAIVVIEFHSSVIQRLQPVKPSELEAAVKALPPQVNPLPVKRHIWPTEHPPAQRE